MSERAELARRLGMPKLADGMERRPVYISVTAKAAYALRAAGLLEDGAPEPTPSLGLYR